MSYNDFPPVNKFIKVLQAYPQGAFLYITLWKYGKKKTQFSILRKEIHKQFLISPTIFRNHCISLARVKVLTIQDNDGSYEINFIDQSNA